MAKQKRDVLLKVRVTPEERAMIETKMAQLGTTNMGAYLRKMAIDGYVVKLDLPELRELVSLLRYSSNNLNQLARRVHETGRVYAADMDDILQNQERIWQYFYSGAGCMLLFYFSFISAAFRYCSKVSLS